jgi:uncharacterized protein (TIGR00661 family)
VRKNILVCPLDWGLGHATRCIPIIVKLQAMGHNVFIAGSGPSLELLKLEFPKGKFFGITSYGISYSSNIPLLVHLLSKTPTLLSVIKSEHREIQQLVEQEKIDFIISDNRYGCYHETIPSAIITHQLSLQLPVVLKMIADSFNTRLIRKFGECWVPDNPSHDLSGKLSFNNNINAKFIGPISRMTLSEAEPALDVLVLVSGPEPQRTIFEELLYNQLKDSNLKYSFIRGLPGSNHSSPPMINHLSSHDLNNLIQSSEIIICRSGYSSIMDLAALRKKAIFVPTPGQTEQLYLAKELERKKIAPYVLQHELSLSTVMKRMSDYTGFRENYFKEDHLQRTLSEFLD